MTDVEKGVESTCSLHLFSVSASSFLRATLGGFCHLKRCIPALASMHDFDVATALHCIVFAL